MKFFREGSISKAWIQLALFSLLLLPATMNTAAEGDAEMGARQALQGFIEDWNAGDLEAIQEHLNFPHVTHSPGVLVVAQSRGEFEQDFDLLRQQGWRRSSFDNIQVLQESDSKVNLLVDFRRYDENDTVIFSGQVFYVMTNQDGHWGMQYRSGGPHASQFSEAELDLVELEATTAIYNFFSAFNAADSDALFATNHIPQVMLNNDFFIYASDRSSSIVTMNFSRMRESENWSHSTAENIEVVHAMPNKVIFQLEFERFNASEEKYRIVPALWVLTKIGGKWGVQFRSLMAPTFEL